MTRAYLATSSRCAGDCACRFFDGLRPAYIILLSLFAASGGLRSPIAMHGKKQVWIKIQTCFFMFLMRLLCDNEYRNIPQQQIQQQICHRQCVRCIL